MRIIVEKGDTLWGITKLLCGNGDRWPELATYNNIKDPCKIYPGDHLLIPFQLLPAVIESNRVLQGE